MRIFVTLQLLLFLDAHQMPENKLPMTVDVDYLQGGALAKHYLEFNLSLSPLQTIVFNLIIMKIRLVSVVK